MEQRSSWEANSHSDRQKTPRLSRNPKVYYRVNKSPPLVSVINEMHPAHTFPPYLSLIHSDIIFPSTLVSSKCSLAYRFSDQNFVRISHLSHAYYMPPIPPSPCLCDRNPFSSSGDETWGRMDRQTWPRHCTFIFCTLCKDRDSLPP